MYDIKSRGGVLVLQHADGEGPGLLAAILQARGIPFDVRRPYRGEAAARPGDAFAGIALLGGPMSVNDPLPWIPRELDLVRSAVQADIPVLGICLGGQLIARALGGSVGPNPVPEIGWLPVERVDGAAAERWLGDLPARFEVAHWHGETFTIPDGAERLLRSEACANQGFAYGSALALQCHPEVDEELLREWAGALALDPVPEGPTVQGPREMLAESGPRLAALARVAEVVLGRWADEVVKVSG